MRNGQGPSRRPVACAGRVADSLARHPGHHCTPIVSAMVVSRHIENATIEHLTAIDGVGLEIAESVVNCSAAAPRTWWTSYARRHCVWQPPARPTSVPRPVPSPQTLAGKTVVVTGSLRAIRVIPPEKRRLSSARQGAGSVSKKTDYVVIGANHALQGRHAEELDIPMSETHPPIPSHRHHLNGSPLDASNNSSGGPVYRCNT